MSFAATLPSGYTQLEYIGTNHDAYILTDLTVNDFDRVTAKVRLLDNSGQVAYSLFGSRKTNEIGKAFYFRTSINGYPTALYGNSKWMHSWSNYVYMNIPLNQMIEYDIKLANGEQYAKIDDTTIGSNNYSDGTISNSYPVPVFAHNYDGVVSNVPYLDCEYITFHMGFNVIANFVPAKRDSDDVIGMYDTVSGQFFENAGTGTFTAGPAVIIEPQESTDLSEYTQLEYLESTGTQWIDTDIKPNQNTSALYTAAVIGDVSNKDVHLFGSRLSYIDKAFNLCYMNGPSNGPEVIKFLSGNDYSQAQTSLLTEMSIKNKHNYYMSGTKVDIDGTNVLNFTTPDYSSNHNLWLFGLNNAGVLHSQVVAQKLYGCKIWNDGILVRDFVPVRRNSDNELGMYDTVSGFFFTNAGTGTFVGGPDGSTGTYTTVLGTRVWLVDAQPAWPYLSVWYNGQKYYIKLSENDYPIHSGSSNKIRIITNGTTYTAHDDSVE